MIPKNSSYFKKMRMHDGEHYSDVCPVCGKTVTPEDGDDLEYVKTKRGTHIFIHTACVRKW
jgi:hypothetical protein